MPPEIARTLVKYGVLGPILVWALYTNGRMTERLFAVLENNTRAFYELKNAIGGLHGRE